MAGNEFFFSLALLLAQCAIQGSSQNPRPPQPQVPPGQPDLSNLNITHVTIRRSHGWTETVEVQPVRGFADDFFSNWERYRWLLIALVPISLFGCIRARYTYHWRIVQQKQQEQYNHLMSKDPLKNLTMLMLPALQVVHYQFEGITKPDQTIDLQFENLGLELPNGRVVLKGVSGEFSSGHLTAIMGSSGAGKTTFMNVLCGKATYGKMHGEVRVNHHKQDIGDLRPVTGFVPQEDIVHELLTVRENIRFSAMLRRPKKSDSLTITKIVNDVLTVLQIGHIQMSIVGGTEERGISGGQRKRVNIGLELAATPTLLFLDEPTSGLDATSSLAIIQSLKKMTELGMTIVMVIHQPRYSLFTMIDDVLLLGKGGETVYLGESQNAKEYFEELGFCMPMNENPADWFMDVLSGEVSNGKEDYTVNTLFTEWKAKMDKERAHPSSPPAISNRQKSQDSLLTLRTPAGKEDHLRILRSNIEVVLLEAWDAVKAGDSLDKAGLHKLVAYCIPGRVQPGKVLDQLWQHLLEHAHKMRKIFTPPEGQPLSYSAAGAEDSRAEGQTVRMEELTDAMVSLLVGYGEADTDTAQDGATRLGDKVTDAADKAVGIVTDVIGNVGDVVGGLGSMIGQASASDTAGASFNMASMRKVPGFFMQFKIVAQSGFIQVYRTGARRIIDLAVISVAALILGLQHVGNTQKPGNIVLFHLALAMLTAVNCLSCLGSDREVYWRERSHGLNAASFSFARMTVNSIELLAQSILYVAVYYLVANPPLPFLWFMEPVLCLSFVCSGWGYLISCLVPPSSATLAAVVLMIISCGALANPDKMSEYIDGGFMEVVVALCPTRWSVQMAFICWYPAFGVDPGLLPGAQGEKPLRMISWYRSSVFDKGQDIRSNLMQELRQQTTLAEIGDTYWTSAIAMMLLQGFFLRLLTVPILILRNRDKQV